MAAAVDALGMDPLDAQIRQVFFFDTPDLALFKKGVVARARRVQKRGDDSVVKLRPVVPSELPDDAARGERKLRKLFSKEQRAFFAAHAPDGVELDDLTVLGPINVLKLKLRPRGFDGHLVAELWLYPDYSRVLELSTKCSPAETFDTAARARAFLHEHGVDVTGEQQTRTRKALRFFARQSAA